MNDKVIIDKPLDRLCPGEARELQVGKESAAPLTHWRISRRSTSEPTAAPWCLFNPSSCTHTQDSLSQHSAQFDILFMLSSETESCKLYDLQDAKRTLSHSLNHWVPDVSCICGQAPRV